MIKKIKILVFSFISVFISCDNEPYEGPLDFNTQISCEQANENLTTAEANFENINATNYNEYCEGYRAALEDYISTCTDDSSEIAELLDSLGDCELFSFFQVDIDGTTFFADSAEATINQSELLIKGKRGINDETVELKINETNEGTYTLGVSTDSNLINIGQYSPDSNNINAWQSVNNNQPQGEITITEIDYSNSLISGSFNFTAYNSSGEVKEFTNGIFQNIQFTKADEFFAKVNGVEFVDVQIVPGINNFGWIGLLARDQQNAEIFVAVRYNAVPGTYSLNQNSSFTSFDYSPSFQDFHYGEGTITITLHNPETNLLMGTFSCMALPEFDGVDTYQITEGRFCVTYLDGSFEED